MQLEQQVLAQAQRVATIPGDILALNKRAVHRQMDAMGLRQGIRAGTEMCALATHQPSFKAFISNIQQQGLTDALQERDEKFGDYRTSGDSPAK